MGAFRASKHDPQIARKDDSGTPWHRTRVIILKKISEVQQSYSDRIKDDLWDSNEDLANEYFNMSYLCGDIYLHMEEALYSLQDKTEAPSFDYALFDYDLTPEQVLESEWWFCKHVLHETFVYEIKERDGTRWDRQSDKNQELEKAYHEMIGDLKNMETFIVLELEELEAETR